jgi:multidrug efflux pump subunit AcrB
MLRDMEGSPVSSFQISDRIREKIGKIPEAELFTVGNRSRWGSPVSITLLGTDMEELEHAKILVKKGLKEIPAISNITDNNPLGKQEVRLKLKPKAYFLGLDHGYGSATPKPAARTWVNWNP